MTERWRLGRFELLPLPRQLVRGGEVLPLGGRAFDVLLALVEARGAALTKEDLLARAWPGVVVEENNLTVQVSAIRKVLGADAVVTLSGRGYRLGLPVEAVDDKVAPATPEPALLSDRPSIAVLPFVNASGDAADAPLCDGVTEDVITELARFRSLFVVSRSSSFAYRGAADLRKVGGELGVRYVLEGSLRRAGERVRVTARLADAMSGAQAWADTFDGVLRDIFALQEQLTRAIVAAIAPQIEFSERARGRSGPADVNAYEMGLRAWALLRSPESGDGVARRERAASLAMEALALDPLCEVAVRTVAWARFTDLWMRDDEHTRANALEAIAVVEHLLAHDSLAHHAHHFKGLLELVLGRNEEGLVDLRRAMELNPNDVLVMCYLGWAEAICGRPAEGLALVQEAVRRSPRDPQRYLLLSSLGWCHFANGDLEAARDAALKSVADAPWFPGPWMTVAITRQALGDTQGAKEAIAQVRRIAPQLLDVRLAGKWLGSDPRYGVQATAWLRAACE